MSNYGLPSGHNEPRATSHCADMQESHPDPKVDDAFMRGYNLGVKHGIEREREAWMKKISDSVIEALREATAPEL